MKFLESYYLSPGEGYKKEVSQIHAIAILSDNCIYMESSEGPFVSNSDAHFPNWAFAWHNRYEASFKIIKKHGSYFKIKKEYLTKELILKNNTYEELLAFPIHFEIETINACNARCPMCTIDEWNKDEKMMSDELFKKIVEEIAQHKDTVKRVNLYRDGEPLLDKSCRTELLCAKNWVYPISLYLLMLASCRRI